MTSSPLSGRKSAGCWATISMPSPHSCSMRVGEAGGALLGDRDAGEALDLHDVALAVELLGEVVGRPRRRCRSCRRRSRCGRRPRSENSRSTLTTGMPCSIASSATGVSGSPSWGRMISTSGSSAMSCSTCDTWAAESLVPSSSTNSTSSSSAASASAFSVMAASQPWSAPGALKAILTVLALARPPPSLAAGGLVVRPESRRVVVVVAALARAGEQPSAMTASPPMSRCCRLLRMCRCPPLVRLVRWPRQRSRRWRAAAARMITPLVSCWSSVGMSSMLSRLKTQAERDDAEEGADDRRPAAGEAGPADDDGGDGVELEQVARTPARRCRGAR